jgi:hypothetical protein
MGYHHKFDEKLSVICCVAWDVAKLALSVGPDKVDIVVLVSEVHALIQGKVVDPVPFGSTGNIKVQVSPQVVSVVARSLMESLKSISFTLLWPASTNIPALCFIFERNRACRVSKVIVRVSYFV